LTIAALLRSLDGAPPSRPSRSSGRRPAGAVATLDLPRSWRRHRTCRRPCSATLARRQDYSTQPKGSRRFSAAAPVPGRPDYRAAAWRELALRRAADLEAARASQSGDTTWRWPGSTNGATG
jgi:hypothetical protein